MKKNKFKNKKVEVDGMLFHSKREYERWVYLNQLQDAHEISELERQVVYELLPSQRECDRLDKQGRRKHGKVIERPVKYIADFVYKNRLGAVVVEDVKGMKKRTPDYVIKRKMMLYFHGIRIKEVL